MADVAVLVPWKGGCPHRERALMWVMARYGERFPRWQIAIGDPGQDPWIKARAVQAAVDQTDADVFVVADADVWCDGVAAAVAVVQCGAGWVKPGCEVRRLTAAATVAVIGGQEPDPSLPLDQKAYPGVPAGGLVVLSRSAWETAPLDSRFVGFGQEDEAWTHALTGLIGKPVWLNWQGWPLWHLWHPPQPRMSRAVGNQAGFALERRYRTSRGSPARLRQLVDEGRPECLS